MKDKIKVLVVDDSALVRQKLAETLESDPDITVVGHAPDPYVARDKIVKLTPDVITLDMEMPKMDGLTFLKKLMKHHPIPVVVVSSHTQEGCRLSFQALEVGAVEVIGKPENTSSSSTFGMQLIDKVKAASKVRIAKVKTAPHEPAKPKLGRLNKSSNKIIAMGASTGGTEALKEVLMKMPADCPPIVIVQHMPKGFTYAFATRLNSLCEITVEEGEDGMHLEKGKAIIAPGDQHMLVKHSNSGYFVQLKIGPMVCRHMPSVEVLFNSLAKIAGKNTIGVLMTGMGRDGAEGLLNLRNSGANTIAQNEASSVVFGMPKEAIEIGAAEKVVSLDKIAMSILSLA